MHVYALFNRIMVIVLRKILILCSVLKERSLVAFVAGRAKISDTNVQTCETSTLWMGVRSLDISQHNVEYTFHWI